MYKLLRINQMKLHLNFYLRKKQKKLKTQQTQRVINQQIKQYK